jgi:Beta propeller domain
MATSYGAQTSTLLTEVDVGDPAAMRVVRTMVVDGAFVSARQTASTARVVVAAQPQVPIAERGRGQAWMPGAVLRDREAGERTRTSLVDCSQVSRAKRFSGVGMLTLLTIDLARGLPAIDADAVMSSGEVAYASPSGLYVATQRWVGKEAPEGRISDVTTEIHQFDVSDPASTEYVASGRVEGFMLSQWSMSEHEGVLRVASTTSPPREAGRPDQSSQSFVTTLAPDGARLTEVGRVGGLGEGEQIYAVRFIGETAYVVTFRQIDPLYVVDLSDPTDPGLLGELKVPGYSAYLHPVGDRLLLGVGQDADSAGATTGVQVSLYDVSDPPNPKRLDVESFGGWSSSEVEYDHHAFLHAPEHDLAVIPLESHARQGYFRGAAGLRVDPQAADPLGRIAKVSHGTSYRAQIRRALVIGDRVFTLSEKGLAAHDPATLTERAFVGL